MSKNYPDYAEGSALESIALRAVMVLSVLALQKPSKKAKPKELAACLKHRLALWERGDLDALLEEGRCLQQRLPRGPEGLLVGDRIEMWQETSPT